jgi:hypothetical protein
VIEIRALLRRPQTLLYVDIAPGVGWHPSSGSPLLKRFTGYAGLVLTSREEELSGFILPFPEIKLIKILDNCSFNELSFASIQKSIKTLARQALYL